MHLSNFQFALPMHEAICLNLSIRSEDPLNILLAAFWRANEESVVEIKETAELNLEIKENLVFTSVSILLDNSFLDKDNINSKNEYTDEKKDD